MHAQLAGDLPTLRASLCRDLPLPPHLPGSCALPQVLSILLCEQQEWQGLRGKTLLLIPLHINPYRVVTGAQETI